MKLHEDITVRAVLKYSDETLKDFASFILFGSIVCLFCWAIFCW
jgi:hypothetical protein